MKNGDKQQSGPSIEEMDKLVKRHMAAAFAAGLVPIPVLDMALLSGVQLNLVTKLADAYSVPFSDHKTRILIGALSAGAVPTYSAPLLAGLLKVIPMAGTVLGMASMPILSAASAYAVGHIFIEHFESGGTLLTFDMKKAAARFKGLFGKGKTEAERITRDGGFESAHTSGPETWNDRDEENEIEIDIDQTGGDGTPEGTEAGPVNRKKRSGPPPSSDFTWS